jgi:pimeloyl-ACP methyl ester carboxylesterase
MASSVDRWPGEPGRTVNWASHTHTATVFGRRVHYLDIGSGAPLVLLHGLGMSWRVWLRNIPDLAKHRRVVAIDLPGFGDSQRIRWQRDLSGHSDVVVELLHRINVRRCALVGHSLGGLVAQHVALRMGEDVGALVLMSSPDAQIGLIRRLAAFIGLASLRTVIYPPAVEQWCIRQSFVHPVMFGRLVADTRCLDTELLTALARGYATNGFWRGIHAALGDSVSERIGALRTPTLVLGGTDDAIVPAATAYRLAGSIPGATLTLWPGVGHAPMLERPAEFNRVIRDFIASTRTDIAAHSPGAPRRPDVANGPGV